MNWGRRDLADTHSVPLTGDAQGIGFCYLTFTLLVYSYSTALQVCPDQYADPSICPSVLISRKHIAPSYNYKTSLLRDERLVAH